jgi:hypothetical protein
MIAIALRKIDVSKARKWVQRKRRAYDRKHGSADFTDLWPGCISPVYI